MERSVSRRTFFWAITLGAGVMTAAALAEVVLRATKPEQVASYRQPCIYWSDAEWGYRYRPNAVGRKVELFDFDNEVRINPQGFHDVERVLADDALRVVAVGDSFTAALHVPIEATWTQVAESALERALLRNVQLYNLGIDGTGTPVHLAVLERMLPSLRPRLVVLGFFANDIDEAARGTVFRECFQGYVINFQDTEQRDRLRDIVVVQGPGERARWWFEHSYLSRLLPFLYGRVTHTLLRSNYLSPTRFEIPVRPPSGDRDVAPLFERLLRLADEWSFSLVVMPLPPKQGPHGSLEVLREALPGTLLARLDVADPTQAMQEAMAREGLEWSDLYWPRDPHLDADGNRLLGNAVAELLAPRLQPPVRRGP